MALFATDLTAETGPCGTEVIARTQVENSRRRSFKSVAAGIVPDSAAWDLHQAVERARLEEPATLVETALHRRRQFWTDTCLDVREMRVACRQAIELHKQYGCCYCAPAAAQVQHVLDALDAALPAWDRDHPVMFFKTLDLNFPELRRFGTRRACG